MLVSMTFHGKTSFCEKILLDFTISAVSSFSAAVATFKFLLGTLYNVREFNKRLEKHVKLMCLWCA